jgi:predicted secreted hydrolase
LSFRRRNGFSLKISDSSIDGRSGTNSLAAPFTNGSYGIWLSQTSLEPVVLHGDDGLIPYGPFGASFYYSWTNLWTFGTVVDQGVPVVVIGDSRMDHQWYSPLALGGWTWFSIQLSNNTQYMLYFSRDGQNQLAQVVATEVKDGRTIHLSPSAVSRRQSVRDESGYRYHVPIRMEDYRAGRFSKCYSIAKGSGTGSCCNALRRMLGR